MSVFIVRLLPRIIIRPMSLYIHVERTIPSEVVQDLILISQSCSLLTTETP